MNSPKLNKSNNRDLFLNRARREKQAFYIKTENIKKGGKHRLPPFFIKFAET